MSLSPLFEAMSRKKTAALSPGERTPKLATSLPGIFHEEAEKKNSPLWTLLLLIEDNFGTISAILDEIDKYFDIRRAPAGVTRGEPDFVTWLGTWVGMVPEKNWAEEKRRFAVNIAADLYKYRGTVTGLRCMLALFFDIDVEIEEWTWPNSMQTGLINTSGIDTRIDIPYNINQCFTVTWKPKPEDIGPELEQKIIRIREMIDREKPAQTFCYLNVIGYEDEG